MSIMLLQLLSPNAWLIAIFGMLLLISAVIGLGFAVMNRRYAAMEAQFGKVVPLWRHALSELSAIMTHPHPFAREMDELMVEASMEPEVPMTPKRYERLKALLVERSQSTDPNLREGENDAALTYLLLLKFAKREEQSPILTTGIQLVSTKAPEDQTSEDKKKQND